jgi:tripeptide aminopeptidase
MNLNERRLAQVFTAMCEIDSPSRQEGALALFLRNIFADEFPDAQVWEDDSACLTGSDTGNLVVHVPGTLAGPPLFFNCHLDTVEPGCGVQVVRQGSKFFSAGETILGGDDKAGIAILLEALRFLKESRQPHLPVDLVFTTCEEVGLLGAKALDTSLLRARQGYALDSSGIDLVITGAPAAVRFTLTISGAAAHAGLHPERGINAIQLAGRAIADLPLGRLDEESTANIGIIAGGSATNIIPDRVRLEGEVRSHSDLKLAAYTDHLIDSVKKSVESWLPAPEAQIPEGVCPGLVVHVSQEYPAMRLSMEDQVVSRTQEAAARLGRTLRYERAGGGSDANIFNSKALTTAIIGIGMDHVHSPAENIDIHDMLRTTELIVSIVTC